jgi:hypothetical protein
LLQYEVILSNLSRLTTYHFRIKGTDPTGHETVSKDYSITTLKPKIESQYFPGATVYDSDKHLAYSVSFDSTLMQSVLLFINMENFTITKVMPLDFKPWDMTYAKDREMLYLISKEGSIQEIHLVQQTTRTLIWSKPIAYGENYHIEYQAPDLLYIIHSLNQAVPSGLGLLNIDSMQFSDLGSKLTCVGDLRPGPQYGEFFMSYKSPTGLTNSDDGHIFKYRLEGNTPILVDRTPDEYYLNIEKGEILFLDGQRMLICGNKIFDQDIYDVA